MENGPSPDAGQKLTPDIIQLFMQSGAVLQKESGDIFWAAGPALSLPKAAENSTSFYNPDFYLNEAQPWKQFPYNGRMKISEFKKLILAQTETLVEGKKDIRREEPNQNLFMQHFNEIKNKIHSGEIQKAVPFIATELETSPEFKLWPHLFTSLLKNSHEGFIYGLWDSNSGILGCTPESLFTFVSNTNELKTMALAGTRATTEINENPLLNDEKERQEHDCVVQDICEKLKNYGTLRVGATYEHTVGALTHLRTDIRLETQDVIPSSTFQEWISTFHPTAALGVYPKSYNWRLIKKWDAKERKSFGAPFGISVDHSYAHAVVAIRNVQWKNNQLLVGSGCGVVADSQFEKEWQELKLKRDSVLRRFQL